MIDYKYSISDLQRCEREMLPAPWDVGDDALDGDVVDRELFKLIAHVGRVPVGANTAGVALLRNAAPVLLEIAAAALKMRGPCDHPDGRCSRGSHFRGCSRFAGDAELAAALDKVRP